MLSSTDTTPYICSQGGFYFHKDAVVLFYIFYVVYIMNVEFLRIECMVFSSLTSARFLSIYPKLCILNGSEFLQFPHFYIFETTVLPCLGIHFPLTFSFCQRSSAFQGFSSGISCSRIFSNSTPPCSFFSAPRNIHVSLRSRS